MKKFATFDARTSLLWEGFLVNPMKIDAKKLRTLLTETLPDGDIDPGDRYDIESDEPCFDIVVREKGLQALQKWYLNTVQDVRPSSSVY